MAGKQQPQSGGSRPGVMGDWSEEQNLGQKGDPDARIKKDEVEAAFAPKSQADKSKTGKNKGGKTKHH